MSTLTAPTTDRFATFKTAWSNALQRELTRACTHGTVAITYDGLFNLGLHHQVIPPGAPSGTNAKWVLHEMFNEIVATFPPHLKRKLY